MWFVSFLIGMASGIVMLFPLMASAKENEILKAAPEEKLLDEVKRRRFEAALKKSIELNVDAEVATNQSPIQHL